MGSMGRLANRWNEKLCSNSCLNTLDDGNSGLSDSTSSCFAGVSRADGESGESVAESVSGRGVEGTGSGAAEAGAGMMTGPDLKLVEAGSENTPFSKFTISTGFTRDAGISLPDLM